MNMFQLLFLSGLAATALAAPITGLGQRAAVCPQVKSTTMIANVTDPALTRDSCGSSRIGERTFWTCRDTQTVSNGQPNMPVIANSASWSTMTDLGPLVKAAGPVGVASTGYNSVVQMYGNSDPTTPFYPILDDECPGQNPGFCDDGTRWAIWPNLPPTITQTDPDGSGTGYTWISKSHLRDLTSLNGDEPPYTLYKTSFASAANANAMPSVSVVQDEFWGAGEIGYGNYGTVVKDGTAYLYGKAGSGTALAKVPASSVEDRAQYQYYVNGAWTSTMPGINDTSAVIPNAGAGGQGTFYYSTYFQSYVWIGQAAISGSADFYLTTAPSPEGTWISPYKVYSGKNGNSDVVGGYSLQAHPALLPSDDASENAIYLTWTQQWNSTTYSPGYVTPMIYMEFQ